MRRAKLAQQTSFEDAALTLIPLLVPLITVDVVDIEPAYSVLNDLALICHPREVVLALNEVLQVIRERAEGIDVSDEEDRAREDNVAEDINDDELLVQLTIVVKCYSTGTV